MPEVGVPRIGVTKVGEVDNTLLPDPVDVVTPVPPFSTAIVVPFHTPVAIVPTEVKEELTTVELSVVPVRVPAAAVTFAQDGVLEPLDCKYCPVEPTVVYASAVPVPYATAPAVGVAVVLVPPFAIGKTPVTPVVNGSPVAFVNVTEVGVPRIGVTKVGLVVNATEPDPLTP